MNNTQSKNYVGSGWQKKFEDGGEIINISLKLEQLQKLPVDKYGNIKLTVAKRKEVPEPTSATHSVYENTYGQDVKQTTPTPVTNDDINNLPF